LCLFSIENRERGISVESSYDGDNDDDVDDDDDDDVDDDDGNDVDNDVDT